MLPIYGVFRYSYTIGILVLVKKLTKMTLRVSIIVYAPILKFIEYKLLKKFGRNTNWGEPKRAPHWCVQLRFFLYLYMCRTSRLNIRISKLFNIRRMR